MLHKNKGCMIGLAVGDALGAPLEFLKWSEIVEKYGPAGLAEYMPWGRFPAGTFTDDTQMSLATALGCLTAHWRGEDPLQTVWQFYRVWLANLKLPQENRVPGNTCVSALRSGKIGTIEQPINDSKGCGGVMRTAPVGLIHAPEAAFDWGMKFSAITHGYPSGTLPGGMIACLIAHLRAGADIPSAVKAALKTLKTYPGHDETESAILTALELIADSRPTVEAIHILGGGWTGEEALAISIYCALKYATDFRAGVVAAINHSGDSDSTGSITGAILGTALGLDAIPADWAAQVEAREYMLALAHDLDTMRREIGHDFAPTEQPEYLLKPVASA